MDKNRDGKEDAPMMTDGCRHVNGKSGFDDQPRCRVSIRDLRWFMTFLCLINFAEGIHNGIFAGSVTSVQRRFQMSSATMGQILSIGEIGRITSLLLVTYFGSHGNRPRIIGISGVVMAVSTFMAALPHFLMDRYRYDDSSNGGNFTDSGVCHAGNESSVSMRSESDSCADDEAAAMSGMTSLFLVSRVMSKLGSSATSTLGYPYLDDHLPPATTGLWVGKNSNVLKATVADNTCVVRLNTCIVCSNTCVICSNTCIVYANTCVVCSNTCVVCSNTCVVCSNTCVVCSNTCVVCSNTCVCPEEYSAQTTQVFAQISQVFEQTTQVFEQTTQVFVRATQVFEQLTQVFARATHCVLVGHGINICMLVIAPVAGFIISGAFLNMYVDIGSVDLSTVTITPRDPRWVGAWWAGFLVCSAAFCLVSVPFFMMPNEMKHRDKRYQKTVEQRSRQPKQKLSTKEIIRGIPLALKRLVLNGVYMGVVFCVVSELSAGHGLATFKAKFMEVQYSLTASQANFLVGAGMVTGSAFGLLLGGYLVKKFKWTTVGCINFFVVVEIMALILYSSLYAFACDSLQMPGVTVPYWRWVDLENYYEEKSAWSAGVRLGRLAFGWVGWCSAGSAGVRLVFGWVGWCSAGSAGVRLGRLVFGWVGWCSAGSAGVRLGRLVFGWVGWCSAGSAAGVRQIRLRFSNDTSNNAILTLNSSCNADCACSETSFTPVCGADWKTYFSPCMAGCKETSGPGNFSSCSCIPLDVVAMPGQCLSACSAKSIHYMVVTAFIAVLTGMGHTPGVIIVLRSVKKADKTYALGLQNLFTELLVSTLKLWHAKSNPEVTIRCDLSPDYLEGGTHTTIPPDILPAPLVPDITVQDPVKRTLTLIELTVPFDQNAQDAEDRKSAKYESLVNDINFHSGYRATLVTVEVGSRGWINGENIAKLKSLCPVSHKDPAIPAPIYFGVAIDNACLLWQSVCGSRGACWVYDTASFRNIFIGMVTGIKGLTIIFLVISLVFAHRGRRRGTLADYGDDGAEGEPDITAAASMASLNVGTSPLDFGYREFVEEHETSL
ncbi:hypothetical protein Bbelb_279280 [Branchiostoma belcheri]|nr:hypothetical protein Bbelb_279280 [Branchiostoma belcheri]